jgi:RNA polymerase sigma-70 factor (ECF subfamily)
MEVMSRLRGVSSAATGAGSDELALWLTDGYAPAFRTAYLILHNRADAEEAVQDAFLRAWRFRAAVPAGEGVRPWLYRVVVNACLSKLRADRARLDRTSALDEVSLGRRAGVSSEGEPEAAAEDRETQQTVLDAVAALPEHLRVVVVLRYYAQLSEREIATVIHRRTGTVKSRMHDARTRLSADPRLADFAGVAVFASRSEAADD